ncbi:MAG: hypothetical protein QXJ11_05620 [Candidatus Bathyarchaeia archaeon]
MTVPNPNSTEFSAIILGIAAFIFIMLLPALIEIKRPKDAGPRMIEKFNMIPQVRGRMLSNVEDEHHFDQQLTQKVAGILSFLYNLEA